jgi:hypothetical protein
MANWQFSISDISQQGKETGNLIIAVEYIFSGMIDT